MTVSVLSGDGLLPELYTSVKTVLYNEKKEQLLFECFEPTL